MNFIFTISRHQLITVLPLLMILFSCNRQSILYDQTKFSFADTSFVQPVNEQMKRFSQPIGYQSTESANILYSDAQNNFGNYFSNHEPEIESTVAADSCDQIILKTGDTLFVKVLKSSFRAVKYQDCTGGANVFEIEKKRVAKITNENTNSTKNDGTEKKEISSTTQRKYDGFAVASFILSIPATIFLIFIYSNYFPLLFAIFYFVTILFGIMGLIRINRSMNKLRGTAFAILGISLPVVFYLMVLVFYFILFITLTG